MPHLRQDALGFGLGITNPVGGLGEGRGSPGGVQVDQLLDVAPPV